jgi:hypothetical protein
MPRLTTRDGQVLEWRGTSICYCHSCGVLFNSVAAFDYHLKRDGKGGNARHDVSGMPRNAKRYLVTKLIRAWPP